MSNALPISPTAPRSIGWLAISWTSRLAVGGYFGYAAVMKIKDSPEVFAKAVRQFEAVPAEWSNAVAITLPWVELVAAALLIACVCVREARAILAVLLLAFVVATVRALLLGLDIRECGCSGANSQTSPAEILVRNTVFLGLLALDGYALRSARRAAPAELADPRPPHASA